MVKKLNPISNFDHEFDDVFETSIIDDVNKRYKRVALCLHGLSSRDKNWILDRLDESDRAKVKSELEELQKLGLKIDWKTSQSIWSKKNTSDAEIEPDRLKKAFIDNDIASIAITVVASGNGDVSHANLNGLDKKRVSDLITYWKETMPPKLINTIDEIYSG